MEGKGRGGTDGGQVRARGAVLDHLLVDLEGRARSRREGEVLCKSPPHYDCLVYAAPLSTCTMHHPVMCT